jgi:hypothetical protein
MRLSGGQANGVGNPSSGHSGSTRILGHPIEAAGLWSRPRSLDVVPGDGCLVASGEAGNLCRGAAPVAAIDEASAILLEARMRRPVFGSRRGQESSTGARPLPDGREA